MQPVQVSFSHVGIFVRDLERMLAFYQRVLGLVLTDRGHLPGRELAFMSGDPREHHQVVLASGRTGALEDKVVNQISFRLGSLEDLRTMHQRLQLEPEATDFRSVNHGNAWTLYFRDPEGNRLELFVDSPWYIAQPRADALDLTRSAADIHADTEALCKADPSYLPAEVWREGLAQRIRAAAPAASVPAAIPSNP